MTILCSVPDKQSSRSSRPATRRRDPDRPHAASGICSIVFAATALAQTRGCDDRILDAPVLEVQCDYQRQESTDDRDGDEEESEAKGHGDAILREDAVNDGVATARCCGATAALDVLSAEVDKPTVRVLELLHCAACATNVDAGAAADAATTATAAEQHSAE